MHIYCESLKTSPIKALLAALGVQQRSLAAAVKSRAAVLGTPSRSWWRVLQMPNFVYRRQKHCCRNRS